MAVRLPARHNSFSSVIAPSAPGSGLGVAAPPRASTSAAQTRRRFAWLGWLIYAHRWLGIAGCLLFIAWFISGIAMMYVRMPTVSPDERALHAEKLELSALA